MQGITTYVLLGRDRETNERIPRLTACQLEIVGQRTLTQHRKAVTVRCNPASETNVSHCHCC